MKLAAVAALLIGVATAKDLSLSWKDCGGPNTKAKITGFSPNSITLGQKTTVTGKGDLSEAVEGATFDLTMTGAIGQLLHCSGDASVSKTCSLPLGSGSLTFEGMKFPISAGTVPVSVDLDLSAALPGPLTKTKTIAKATSKNGDELFCMEIDSAPAAVQVAASAAGCPSSCPNDCCVRASMEIDSAPAGDSSPQELESYQAAVDFVQSRSLKLDWKDCGGPNTKAKITGFSPNSVTLGQKTTVTGKGDLSEAVEGATFDLTMTGVIGQLLHCSGDASVSKTCSLPLGSGSLTFEGMKFPISAGTVPVSVDLDLSAALPGPLTKTKTIAKATAKNGDELFCMEIDSAPAAAQVAAFASAGGCSDSDQTFIHNHKGSGGSSFGATAAACGKSAYSIFSGFNIKIFNICLTGKTGISQSCSNCFAQTGKYGADNCKLACLSSWCSSGCLSCTGKAKATLESCTGFKEDDVAPCDSEVTASAAGCPSSCPNDCCVRAPAAAQAVVV